MVCRLCTLLGIALVLVGCRGVDPARYSSDGRPLAEMPRVPYKILLAPLDSSGAGANSAGTSERYSFSLDDAEVQKRLARHLRALNVSTDLVAVRGNAASEADERGADLIVRPVLREQPYLDAAGRSDRVLLSSALWFFTWLGGLWIEDSRYEARMDVEFQIVDPHTTEVLERLSAKTAQADLPFVDRQSGAGFFQSVILPPIFARDNNGATSESLSETICLRLAGDLARHFKEDFRGNQRAQLGELRLSRPANGAYVGKKIELVGQLAGARAITEIAVHLNGSKKPAWRLAAAELPTPAEQRSGNRFVVPLKVPLSLAKGRNAIRIHFRIGSRLATRTLLVTQGRKPS